MQFDFKKIKTDLLIVLCFAAIALIYCYPQLQGKILKQDDSVMWKCMAHEAMAYHDATGKDALWSNSMFGGMPTYTTYVGCTNYNYPLYVQRALQLIGKPAYFFFIAMLCFYILARVLRLNQCVSIIGAVAYAFASYNPIIIFVGHETKMLTIGFMPAAFAGFYLIYKEKWLTGAALFGLSIALIATNNHFQMMYYIIIMLVCFAFCWLYIAIKEGRIKQFFISSAIALVVGILGVLPNITSVVTTNEYTKETMRGGASELSGHDAGKKSGGLDKEYAFRWSAGIGETFCFMIPYLYGGATYDNAELAPKTLEAVGGNADLLPTYWGEQPTQSGPVFFGAIICFLFVLGLLIVRSPHKWWMLAACIIGTVLAWGKNLPGVNYFLFDHVPLLNKFRTVEMAMVIPQFLFPILGIWGLQEALDRKDEKTYIWRQVAIAAGITAGLCVLIGIGGSAFYDFSGWRDSQFQAEMVKLLKEDRASLAMTSSLKSACYILLAAGILWAYLNNKIRTLYAVVGIGLVMAIDIFPVALNYLSGKTHNSPEMDKYVDATEYDALFEPRDVDKMIMKDPDPYYRVLDLSKDPYNDAMQAYFHKCIGGYHPAKMEMYQDLINRQMGNGFNAQVLNMLNTKYIIVGRKNAPPQVMPNSDACGNAWFVDEVKWANSAEEEMNGLNASNIGDTSVMPNAFNPRKTAVIRSTFKNDMGNYTFGKDSISTVKLTQYGLDDLSFESRNSKDGLAIFSDIYYNKGWKAYVDGKETPIVKANYVLRAIKIPAGNHKIEFHFMPESFYNTRKVQLAGSIAIICLCLGAVYSSFKNSNKTA